MKIQVLGTGCAKCKQLTANAEKAVAELGLGVAVEKVEDIREIMKFRVMTTPALVVDGTVRSAGKVLTPGGGEGSCCGDETREPGVPGAGVVAFRRPRHGPSLGAVGMLYQAQGDLDRADAALRQRLRLEPGSLPAILLLGQNLLLQGRYEESLATYASCPDEDYRLWGTALAAHSLGRASDSSAALAELTRRFAHVKAFDIAVAHAWRGERQEAFAWLHRAREQDDPRMSGLLTLEPLLASLRDDPRYGALLARMNLPAR